MGKMSLTFFLLAGLCLLHVNAVPAGHSNKEEGVDHSLSITAKPIVAPPGLEKAKGPEDNPHFRRKKRSLVPPPICDADIEFEMPPQTFQEYMVKIHNLRRTETAVEYNSTNENKLAPSEMLAMVAQDYANQCIWDHGSLVDCDGDRNGQNLYFVTNGGADNGTVDGAMNGWYTREKGDYDMNTGTCASGSDCGHYTQVIWGDTEYVGCGVKNCDTLYDKDHNIYASSGIHNYTLIVCNYYPPGNYPVKPFQTGPICNGCKGQNGASCSDSLCTQCNHIEDDNCFCPNQDSCVENGGYIDATNPECTCICNSPMAGNSCEVDCETKSGDLRDSYSCNYYRDLGYCTHTYVPFMMTYCKDTCACEEAGIST